MEQFDSPAELERPLLGDEEPAVIPAQPPSISSADALAAQGGVDAAFKAIKAQPTTKIRVPKVYGPQVVIINGARFNVPANVFVEVPEQVAQVLRDSGRI